MMDNKFIGLMVGLTVGILLVSGFLWPIVADATAVEETFENKGYYSLTKLDETSETTVSWDAAHPTVFNIDGVDIDVSATGRLTVLGSDSICVRYNTVSNTYQVQVFGSYGGTQGYKAASAASNDKLTITISNGIVNVSIVGEASKQFDLGNDAYLLAPDNTDAEYVAVMKITTENAYLLEDSEIVICGISVANSQTGAIGVFGKGTMADGMTFSSFFIGSSYTGDVTFSDVVTDATTVSGYEGLYALEKYTATINYNGGNTSNATYSYFIVPAEVTAEKSWHLDTTQIALVAAIGTLGAIVLIAAAAGSIRRLD